MGRRRGAVLLDYRGWRDMAGGEEQLSAGATIGAYAIVERIASGGFGTVYRASDPVGAEVALKVLHADLCDSREAVARFEREVRAVGRLRHPHVARIHDVGRTGQGVPFFAMELLHGTDLRGRVRAAGRLGAAEVERVLAPLCDALAAAHDKGIVHRDVKSSNVFLAGDRVVLLDFGVAKLIDDSGERVTATHRIVGSPPCMAPEQILGERVDARTDVYALGVLAYELLTGRVPFAHSNPAAVYDMHLDAPPPLPSRRAPVDAALDALVCRAMAKDPGDRFASARELAAAFRAAVASPPVVSAASAAGAIGVHVAVHLKAEMIEALDDAGLRALDDALPRAQAAFEARGFRLAMTSGNAALLIGARGDPAQRADALALACAVQRALAAALAPLGGVAAVCLAMGAEAELVRPAWVPDGALDGVYAPAEMVEGAPGRAEQGPPGFVRIARSQTAVRGR